VREELHKREGKRGYRCKRNAYGKMQIIGEVFAVR
jgi:hypothetical protein